MSHEITSKDNLFYVGEKPWHGIGKRVDHVLTASEAIIAANLGWAVTGVPIYDNNGTELKDYQAIKREDTGDVFQVCKKSYTPVQNTECFRMFDEVVGTGLAKYEIAGSLQGGKKVWMLAKLPYDFSVNGSDEVNSYITLINGHDGSLALQMYETPVRVVCSNTLRASINNRSNVVSARHTISGKANFVNRASVILAKTKKYFEEFKLAAITMAKKEMIDSDINAFLKQLFEVEGKTREEVSTRVYNQMREVKHLINYGTGNTQAGIRGTAWAAYNGVTEYVDHKKGTDENRLTSSWLGSGAELRERAFELLLK
jgi:phage/plasmid-like protein (TIGR03299 family)